MDGLAQRARDGGVHMSRKGRHNTKSQENDAYMSIEDGHGTMTTIAMDIDISHTAAVLRYTLPQ